MTELTWTPDTARLDSLELWEHNPKWLSAGRKKRLAKSWRDLNQWQTLAVGPGGEVYDGHQRVKTLLKEGYPGDFEIYILRSNRPLTDEERRRIIIEGTVGTVGAFDWDELAVWPAVELQGYGLDAEALAEWNDAGANLAAMLTAEVDIPVAEPPDDFKEYNEDIETEHVCPRCGYRWSGKINLDAEG